MAGSRSARIAAACAAAATVLALAACDAPTIPADGPSYEPRFRGRSGALLLFHWPLGRTINVYVDSRGAPPGLDLAEAVRVAAATWRVVVLYREFGVRIVRDLSAADVLFRWDEAPSLLLAECPGGVTLAGSAGVTAFCPDEARGVFLPFTRLDGGPSRVKFEVTITSDTRVVGSATRLDAIVAHEVGHLLGIGGHSPVGEDLMYPSPGVPVPSLRDVRTLRYVLRQPADLTP